MRFETNIAVVYAEHIASAQIDLIAVKQATRRYSVFSRVINYVVTGWPVTCPGKDLCGYFIKGDEISVKDDILL